MPDDTLGLVIGDGPERSALESLVEDLGLRKRVHFTGALPSASEYLSALDVFALTSRTEGTPMTLLEAMAAGVPIVATDVGGVPALLGDERWDPRAAR